jgi:acetyltransferase
MADEVAALRAAGVPVFTSPERGAEAAALLARYAEIAVDSNPAAGEVAGDD